jgi:FKBP-type peptidyl-prolyl cis-trans isomerase
VRRVLALLLAVCLVFATAACGDDSSKTKADDVDMGQKIKGLSVSGEFGAEPKVTVKSAVKTDKPETQVLSKGDGNPVVANKKAMFNIYLAKGSDGSKLYSSTDQGTPSQVNMTEKEFFKVIIDSLVGKPQGSRVAVAATVKDVWGAAGAPQLKLKPTDTVLFVLDVLSVEPKDVKNGPEGKDVAAPAAAPVVQESGDKVTGLDFSKAPKKAPSKLQVIPLVEGDGPAAKAGRLVTFNYYGAVWGSKKPFDSSFDRGAPVPFGVGVKGLIPAWDKVIPGLKQGSRVLIIAPPADGYGAQAQQGIPANSTLTFVVDVLGVDA